MSNRFSLDNYNSLSDEQRRELRASLLSVSPTQETAAKKEQQGAVGNFIDAAQEGASRGAGGIFSLAESLTGAGEAPANFFYDLADKQQETMSDQFLEDRQKPIFDRDEAGNFRIGEGATNANALLNLFGQAAGSLAVSVGGGGAGGIAARLASKGLSLGAKGAQTASTVGTQAGFIGAGGGSAQGLAGQDAYDSVKQMDPGVVRQSTAFQELWNSDARDEGLTDEENEQRIIEQLATSARDDVIRDPKVAAVNFGLEAVVGRVAKGLFDGTLAKTRKGNALLGGGAEAGQEFGQEYVSGMSVNEQLRELDPTVTDENLLPQAATGALGGFGVGAPLGAIGRVNRGDGDVKDDGRLDTDFDIEQRNRDAAAEDLLRPGAAREAAAAAEQRVAEEGGDSLDQVNASSQALSQTLAERKGVIDQEMEQARASNQVAVDRVFAPQESTDPRPLPAGGTDVAAMRAGAGQLRRLQEGDVREQTPPADPAARRADRMAGIDGAILMFERMGDTDAATQLSNVRALNARADTLEEAGKVEFAKKLRSKAGEIYSGYVDDKTATTNQFPVAAEVRGEFVPRADVATSTDTQPGVGDTFDQAADPLQVGDTKRLTNDTRRLSLDTNTIPMPEPADVTARRKQKTEANEQALEGVFPVADGERINQMRKADSFSKAYDRESRIEAVTSELPTPKVDEAKKIGLDARWASDDYRDRVKIMAGELESGGGIAYITDEFDRVQGRTESQNMQWFQDAKGNLGSVEDVKKALNKAMIGQKLGVRQAAAITAMMDEVDNQRISVEGIDGYYDTMSQMDEAQFRDAMDVDTESSIDSWVPAETNMFFDEDVRPELRSTATVWDLARGAGVPEQELIDIAARSTTSEELTDNVFRRFQQAHKERYADTSDQRDTGPGETVSGQTSEAANGEVQAGQGLLSTYTESDLQDRAANEAAANQSAQNETRLAEQKAQADTEANDFRLSGSNLPADIATAGGQDSLLNSTRPVDTLNSDKMRGDEIDDQWTAFSSDSGTLNIPRDRMPQVKAEHRGALANFLKARGVIGTDETVPSSSLKPTQKEFSEAKVQKAKEFEGGDRAILVSGDGHVLDGHHQWMAKRDNGEDVRVIRLDAPIESLLEQIKEFPSVEQSDGSKASDAKPAEPSTSQEVSADTAKPLTLTGDDLDTDQIVRAYSHSVRNVNGAAKLEKEWYTGFIDGLREDLSKDIPDGSQRALESGLRDIAAQYIQRRNAVLNARSGVASSSIAGRSNFNSRQADRRGNALDRAEDNFTQWKRAATRDLADSLGVSRIRAASAAAKAVRRAASQSEADVKLKAMDKAESDRKRALPIVNEPTADVIMTKAEWAKTPKDYKGISAADTYRYRTVMREGGTKTVYISDQKEVLQPVESSAVDAKNQSESRASQEAKSTAAEASSESTTESTADNQELPAVPDDGYNYDHHKSVFVAITKNGDAIQSDDVRASFEAMVADPDAIKKQLSKLTIKDLTPIARPNFSGEKKSSLVDMAFKKMITDYEWLTVHEAFMTSTGGYDLESKISGARKRLDGLTQKDLRQYADDRKAAVEERKAQITALNKSLKNPETLEEFEAFVQYKGKDKFSPEQLRQYDALKAGKSIEEMDAERAAKAVKSGLDIDDELDINPIEESVHGKTGEPIFNVSLKTRLGKDKFKEAAGMARSMGGGYWKGNFYFKSREDAELFTGWLQGEDVDNSDKVAERQADKQDRRVSKLRELAEKTEAKGNEKINADRQTNTARRARMAASAENSAAREIEYARILRNVADAVDAGNAPFLANLSATTQLSELLSIKRLAIPSSMRNDPNYDGYSSSQGDLKKGITVDDYAPLIEMPRYAMYGEMVVDLGRDIANIAGLKRLSDQLIKEGGKAKDKIAISPDAVAKIKAKVGKYYTNKYGRREKFALPWQLERQAEQIGRLERMGITTGEHLRAAIRELDAIEQSSEKVKLDPLRDKVRALVGKKIAGFFPTPEPVVERLLDEADIQPGMAVLEPSAGKGDIADAIREANPDAQLEVVEIDSSLRDLLAAKGYEPTGRNFLEQQGEYDRIVMNPPFEKNADIEHVRHAYSLLKPGGRLVAVTSGMAGHRSDKVNSDFKAWVEEIGGVMEPLPDGSFKSSFRPTGVSTQLVVMDKPEILYSRSAANEAGATPKGVGLGLAKIAINKFLKQYKGANDVTIKVFRTHEEAHGSAAPFRTKGGYDPKSDTLFIYTEALDSIADLEETLQHELLVHKGLGFVDPATLSEFLTSLRNAAKDSPELEALYNEVERVEDGRSDALKAEEILARIAQDRLSFPDKVWNRIVLAVQRLMNRMFGRDISARRQGRDLVYRIGDAFAEGKRAGRRTDIDGKVYSRDQDGFILNERGKREFGQITTDTAKAIRRQSAPIMLTSENLEHINEQHESEILSAGFDSAEEFVSYVATSYTQIRQGKNGRLIIAVAPGEGKRTGKGAVIQLTPSESGDFYTVETATPWRWRSMEGKTLLWEGAAPPSDDSGNRPRFANATDKTGQSIANGSTNDQSNSDSAINNDIRQDDGPESPAWKAAKAKGLDMSKEARMQRARDMGFDTDTVYYHGTAHTNIEQFSPRDEKGELSREVAEKYRATKKAGEPYGYMNFRSGIFFSPKPEYASHYTAEDTGVMYPVYLKMENPLTIESQSNGLGKSITNKGATPDALILLDDDGSINEVAIMDPSQIRSVNAAFDPDQADSPNLMYSRTAELDPDREAVMSKIGLGQDTRTPIAKVKDSLRDWWREVMEGFIPAVADKFYDLKKINAEAYMRARMSTNTGAALAAALGHATPEWHEDGILKGKRDSKGLLDILKPVEGDVNNWVAWMVGKRAERLMSEGRENLLSDADIQELLSVTPEQESRFQEVADQWQEYNGAMLDVMAGGGLITQEDADFYKQDPYYIPFYRESLDSNGEVDVAAPFTKKGLSHQKDGIEALKGGESQLQDPLKNILMNVTRAIDASVKNNALRRVVDEVDVDNDGGILTVAAEGDRAGKNVIRVRRNSENEYYRVHDVGVLGALTAMNDMQTSTLTRALGIPKRLLTAGVTATPTFMLRNAIRDITASWMQSEDVKWQGNKALGQFRDALKIDDDTIDMMMAGSAFMGGHRYSNDASSNADALREQLRAKGMSTASIDSYMSSLFDGSKRAWEWYKEKGERFENMARQKMFRDALDDGHSYFDAAYRAKDLMDFSLHGRAGIMHFLIQTVPFMNARIQGLYKLGRVAGNQKNMASLTQMVAFKGTMLAAATLALYALNEDDEKYQELPDWDKDANWHIFLGGEHLRIPKPFELGLMFSTIPERAARLATGDDDAKAFFGSVGRNMIETLSMNPMPQAVMPVMEAAFNYDLFRARNIDSQSDLSNLPGSRKSLYTSELAKGMGAMLEDMGVTGDMASPKRIDHIIKGYTGSMGISLLSATDAVVHLLSGNVRPAMNQRDYPVIGWFARGDDPVGTKYSDDFYRLMGRANQAYSTIRDPNTDDERRAEIIEEYGSELKARRMLGSASKQLSKMRKRREAIYRDTALTAEQKRQQLNNIQSMINEIQKRSVERASAYDG